MNRAIVEACIPCVIALAAACLLFVVIVRLTGGRWSWTRIGALHRCQEGSVQSLSFVLTLPLLIMIVLFIVQVSQLMIGLVVVNYAAFAAARAASVWSAAWVDDGYASYGEDDDGQNELPPGIQPGTPLTVTIADATSGGSRKYQKILSAAALACATISPSRATPEGSPGLAGNVSSSARLLYQSIDPASSSNSRIGQRLDRKLAYSFENTHIDLLFEDRNSVERNGTRTYNPIGHPIVVHNPAEVGWQDPITVTVYHDLALLPGAGNFLSKLLVPADGKSDRVAPRIKQESGVYKTRIFASATMTNEGIQSLRPFIHPAQP